MRNTTHKLFHDKTLRHLHDDCNICGVVKNHFLARCMRYYRRYGKGLSYRKMSKHLTKLKKLEKYRQMFYKQNAKKLANAQKAYSRKVKGSHNQERCRKQVARIHKKTANQRTDHHWKLAINLCRKFDIMFFEDLNLRGMKALFGKQVSDLAFGEFLEKLKHQSKKRIRSVLKINRWSPTTKACCVCGHKNENLTLADRHWTCPKCHTHLDRDQNAAMNILQEGVASFRLGVVRPIVLFNRIVGISVEATSPLLNSTNASA